MNGGWPLNMANRVHVRWWYFILIIGVLFTIPRIRNYTSRSLLWMSRPLVIVGQWLGQLDASTAVPTTTKNELQQIHDLSRQLFQAKEQLAAIQEQNALVRYASTSKQQIVSASVVASSPDPGIQSITIDRGSDDGITSGQIVVNDQGVVVGKVVSAHQTVSTVLLVTDGQFAVSARIQNDAGSPGAIRGQRGLTVTMSLIPKNDNVQNGETIVTSGSDPHIPPDILLGSVSSVASRAGDLFQVAQVTPAADVRAVRIVGVIIH